MDTVPGGIRLGTRVFRLEEVDCLGYRLPDNCFPIQIGLQGLVFGFVGLGLILLGIVGDCECILNDSTYDCLCWDIRLQVIQLGAAFLLTGLLYPRYRLREHLYRYTLHRDPLWQERCAALLHFYEPLLTRDSFRPLLQKGRTSKAIPLDF